MAEIRSTMDMVMERAEKMAARSQQANDKEDAVKRGMRMAAEHLQKGEGSLMTLLKEQSQDDQIPLLQGMAETLLRNIVLPRDDYLQETSLQALQGIAELSTGEVSSICEELQQILGQYNQHKEQMQQQLEDAIRSQLKQKLMEQGTEVTDEMAINPALHPQFQEELAKLLSDLNGQYNDAMDQRKEMIRQRMVPTIQG